MNPTFSVVVSTYNRAKYLIQTLESIALQDYPVKDYELIIIDNNSTDHTEEVCHRFISSHPDRPIHYFKELQQGISYGRNRGVCEAHGTIIAFVDDDETIQPDYLSVLNGFFVNNHQAALCCGPVIPVYEATPPDWLSPYISRLITGAYDRGVQIKILGAKDCPGTGHATFKKDLFVRFGAFNTDLGRKGSSLMGAEDKDFFLRLIENGIDCYYLPQAKIFHHIPASKLTEDFFTKITYALGKSERIRTRSVSRTAYYKRLLSEGIKWGGSIVLFFYYLLCREFSKGWKLIQFRYNVTRGLLHSNDLQTLA